MSKIDEVRKVIVQSDWYTSGEGFLSSNVAPLIDMTPNEAGKYLSVLHDEGTLDKEKVRRNRSTVALYCKPNPKSNLLSVAWNKHTNLGVV